MKTVVIFGGSGFVGQHIVRRLAKKGFRIVIPYQTSINEAKLRILGVTGQITPLYFIDLKDITINNILKESDIIINLKTIWDEKKTSFNKGIYKFNKELVDILNKIDIKKNKQFIFFSGLGVDQKSDSKRIKIIANTEEYLQKNLNNILILRPGIIIGGGDLFLKRLLPIFKFSFFIPLFGSGNAKLQPVFIDDVAKAVELIITKNNFKKNIFELFGPEIFTYKSLYTHLKKCLNKTRVFVPIPFNFMKLSVSIIEKLPINLLTTDQLLLFKSDNLPQNIDKNFKDLYISPQDIREIIRNFIDKK